MRFTVQVLNGIGVYTKKHTEFQIKIKVRADDVKRVHDLFMCESVINGGRHYEMDYQTGIMTLMCGTGGNHAEIGKILPYLVVYDQESYF